jgi:uncharacterized protein
LVSTGSRDSRRKEHLLRLLRWSLGVLFILLGIAGALLPILQGWIFFLLAFILLFPDHHKVAEILDRGENRFPRLIRTLRRMGIGPEEESDDEDEVEDGEPGEGNDRGREEYGQRL